MTSAAPNSASAATARTESGNDVCFGGEQFPDSAPAQKYQARILVRRFGVRHDHLRLVEPPPPQASRRYETRITVSSARLPIGRSRAFRLTESDVEVLIDAAMQMERRA